MNKDYYFATGNVVEFINSKYIVIKKNNSGTIDMIPLDCTNCSATPWSDDYCEKYRERMAILYKEYVKELNARIKCETQEVYDKLAQDLWDGNNSIEDYFSAEEYKQCKPENVEAIIKGQSMAGVKYLADTVKDYIIDNVVGDIF